MRPIALEKDEVLRLLEAAKRHGPRAHAMVLLAIRHGLRASEVCGLRLEHVNLKEAWVRVERLKGSMTTVQALERHPGQPLLDEVRVLGAWLRERQDDGSGILFTSTHGGAMNRSTFFRLWRRLAAAADLPQAKWHPHVAKHTTGTLLVRSGASAFLVRQHLGHRSISSSQVYCSVSDRDASAAARSAFMQAF
jgi:type 1 fimbriae regulatory protein FimB